jgi:8-oxo-dGTP pyrophosphatase MutT (NUDIX family)
MKHTYSAGGVIINSKGLVLVVSQHGTSWSLPKGTLEPGEDKKAAAIREIEEETGITKLDFIRELGTYQRYMIGKHGGEYKGHRKTITMYLIQTPEENLAPQDPENPEARWVEPDKVSQLLTHKKDKAFFESVLDEVNKFIVNRES